MLIVLGQVNKKIKVSLISLVTIGLISSPVNSQSTANVSIERLKQRAKIFWQQGKIIQAIEIWQQESQVYKEQKKLNQEAEVILKIAQGYIKLGDFKSSIDKLNYILTLNTKNANLQAKIWENLGNALSGTGKFQKAIVAYQQSLRLKQSLSCLNNLVKTWKSLIKQTDIDRREIEKEQILKRYEAQVNNYRTQALNYAQKAAYLSETDFSLSAVYALINWASLSQKQLSPHQIAHASRILNSQPPSRSLVFSLINWSQVDRDNSWSWLLKAQNIAQLTNDALAQSYTSLELAYFYERTGALERALEYGKKTQLLAQGNFLYDSLFRAQWLTGRIYRQQNKSTASLASYQNAIAALDSINQDLYSWDNKQTIDFKAQIEPIYRELIELLLAKNQVSSQDIKQALLISDKLRLSKLQNLFGDNCFQISQPSASQVGRRKEAIISSIILETQTYVILQLPDGSIHLNQLKISKSALQQLALKWRQNLTNKTSWEFQIQGRQLYELLIRPLETQLAGSNFEVLVFVHDGILRNLPMSALFDGEEFLVEKWASVSSLGLGLRSPSASTSELKALVFGLSNPQSQFSILSMIREEAERVHQIIGGKKYLNRDFTISNLKQQLAKNYYSVVHLATHAYFAGNTEDSFLLAYDGKISIFDLEQFLNNQRVIELLVLSACETAMGSERSLLGLAGVAARSGVKSTLGSLWQVQDDEQSEMILRFYDYWTSPEYNKATALQKIQIEQIKQFAHPQQWAALSLIGDYL